ncbi:enoyl-CoA hydratase/isomerase family protein [Pseudovibrio sp. Tun.PSC04-5.I4]|uniref:enoyl-CoA hydratase/isomerase family protein n=1 Tax=Pseudovibrio sp. Tun.PSC04-5.I4 TaxID=1798213 RepID=UPI00087EBD93|nr:enoyl-CoA hydratase/isomerase family protein [Pseudovibrio sp. Tun.PSC04-5.I4]SDR33346.1 isohexenylglutaconyl-CoA hydratase [Pseudovibrio sp. Tun.PSC04-5.I4]
MSDVQVASVVLCERQDAWLTITLNQPEKRNPLTSDVIAQISQALREVREDRSLRGITITGAGGVFCAGGDLKAFQKILAGGEQAEALAHEVSLEAAEFFALVAAQPQVTVALVEGAAMAGGLGMACACDFIVTTNDAKFAFSETRIGLPPAQIAQYVIKRLGYQKAKKMLVLGSKLTGAEAGQLELADVTVADATALKEAEAVLQKQVLACAPGAVAATKGVVEDALYLEQEALRESAASYFAKAVVGDEGQEGVMSFMQKRKPSWTP